MALFRCSTSSGGGGSMSVEDEVGFKLDSSTPYSPSKDYKIFIFVDRESSSYNLSQYIKLNSQNLPSSAEVGTARADSAYYNYIVFYDLKSTDVISTTSQTWRAMGIGLN